MTGILRFVRPLLVAAIAGLLGAAPAAAQDRGSDPAISTRDLDAIAEMVDMEAEQTEIARILHEDYLAAHGEATRKYRAFVEEIREAARDRRDRSLWEKWRETRDEYRAFVDDLEQSMLDDVKLLLRPEQATRWPRVERRLRRQAELDGGLISGVDLDVVDLYEAFAEDEALADRLDAEPAASIAAILDAYELAVDAALVARARFYETEGRRGGEEWLDERRDIELRIRDANRRSAEQIATALPPDLAERFRAEVAERLLPRRARSSSGSRFLRTALELDSLDAAQRTAIESLQSEHDEALGRVNERLLRSELRWDRERPASSFERRRRERVEIPDWLDAARDARRDLDERTTRRLAEILTEAQQTAINITTEDGRPLPDVDF